MKVSNNKNSRSISQFMVTFISFGLFAYFFFHLAHGDRGYFASRGVEEKLAAAEAKYEKIHTEREALESRVKLLRPDSLDADMLDERARVVLGFMKADEVVLLDKAL